MRRSLSVLLLSSVLLGACSVESFSDAEPRVEASRSPITQATVEPPHSALSDVVAEVLPSVVNVKVKSVSLSQNAPPLEGAGEGSGVVIDEEGIILTNYHVVAGAVSVRVVFTDDREPLTGTVIGGDRERDLAVIQVEADDLDAIPVGNSERLRLGDTVIAIGFPLGLGGPTVTSGILSGTERRIQAQASFGIETLVGLLQTDAAINPGNSGGPLVDFNGRLVGINTAVAGSAENIGFAIAIDEALPIVNEILIDPPEEQAWLGVQLGDVTSPAIAQELGLPADAQGAVVFGLIPDSPAEEAGLEEGDVVVSLDGEEITSSSQLIEMLRGMSPGREVTLEVLSPDGTRSVTAKLEQRPVTFDAPTPTPDE